ncbi:MAG: N-6 DNA methylase [Defluviicoccus sp.]|nr:N-6 DNA methylase [Defluviicoccus sp.]MDE0277729.1 N-6 DNA methylase [Defluviicoccus sp.]
MKGADDMTCTDTGNGYPARALAGAKEKGAYYTPDEVVRSLLRWAVHSEDDRLLDPSCGDGRFIAGHSKSVGIEQDPLASAAAMRRAPGALVHEGDFFAWAGSTEERFECAAGNPPFIRYQRFKGPVRKRALELCGALGASFSALSSSWPLFLVVTGHLLHPDGRMAFVVPAEIGHAPYSAPLIEFLAGCFSRVQVVAVKEKLFPELSEDCWLLYADGKGGSTATIDFSALERFVFRETPPPVTARIALGTWKTVWNRRLRPFLMPKAGRDLYEGLATGDGSLRLGSLAHINIGYVSGANDFFHLRQSEARQLGIPDACLQPTVRNARALPPARVNSSTVRRWLREDRQTLLLRLDKDQELPGPVHAYLSTERAKEISGGYKCRTRDPWYVVPDVKIPDYFLTYMSGRRVSLVQNSARCACTNSLHAVRLKDKAAIPQIRRIRRSPLFQLSCEIEGHPLGGGMLKLEPREACNILIPSEKALAGTEQQTIRDGIAALQGWRHYEAA